MQAAATTTQTAAVLRWVSPPRQERTRLALNAMLDAAEQLVAEKGFDAASIVEISTRAGCSVGGFYRRFKDKNGLLHALHERFCEEAQATADEALDPQRWRAAHSQEIVSSFTAFLIEIYQQRAGLLRAFLVRGVSDDEVRSRTEELVAYLAAKLGDLLAEHADELGHPDPAMASDFGLRVVLGVLVQTLLLQQPSRPLAGPHYVEELARVLNNYLGTTSAAA